MEQMFKKFLSVVALFSAITVQASSSSSSSSAPGVLTYINGRSVSFNSARRNSGEAADQVHKFDMDERYGNFSVAIGGERTFRPSAMAKCLFGNLLTSNPNNSDLGCNNKCDDECSTILVQGSTVADRSSNAILADYFYLPTDFSSTLSFKPQISSFFVDFNYYMGLDSWWKGGYLRLYTPFVHTRRTLHMTENVIDDGTQGYPAGYFDSVATPVEELLPNATAFLSGGSVTTDNITGHGLCFGKIRGDFDCNSQIPFERGCDGDSRTKNGLADLRAELGWNFWQNEDYHFGLNLQAAAPTGTRPKAKFLFDAVVGNGKHWELGGGATGHYTFWRGCDESRHFSINMDLSVLHLFGAKQQRVFDLAGKPLSRYMLAAKFRPATASDTLAGGAPVDAGGTKANFIFANEFTPVANLTTQDVKVSVGAQVDFNLWFNFSASRFSADFGYNLWYSGCERINCLNDECPLQNCCDVEFENNTWAVKGDEYVFGFHRADLTPQALSASDSTATILGGTAQPVFPEINNEGVDNPLPAFAGTDIGSLVSGNDDVTINTSIQTKFINANDLGAAISSAMRSRQLSNKVWGYVQYTWDREEGYVPYLGIGASGEFGGRGCDEKCNDVANNNTTANCNSNCETSCIKCTPSQWSVWGKLGFTF